MRLEKHPCPNCDKLIDVPVSSEGAIFYCPECAASVRIEYEDESHKDTMYLESVSDYVPLGESHQQAIERTLKMKDGGVTLSTSDLPEDIDLARVLASDSTTDKYVVQDELGRGSMGAVFRTVDINIRREVATKMMIGKASRRSVGRFIQEAQVTGQLEHPNIVPVHDFGIDPQGRLYFTMKMIRGRSLSSVIEELKKGDEDVEEAWPLNRLLDIFLRVCNAIAFAHSRGVIHRDIKPANIMLGDYGEVLVTDWGVSKVMSQSTETDRVIDSRMTTEEISIDVSRRELNLRDTLEGSIMGSPYYMSPEQAAGRNSSINERSDVYSLGAMLYELLTLEKPVESHGIKTMREILDKIQRGEIVSPEDRAPERSLPKELTAVALKAMSVRQEDRYASVMDLRRDVEQYMRGHAVSAREDTALDAMVRLIRRNRAVSLAIAVSSAVLLGMAGYTVWRVDRERRLTQQAFDDYRQEQTERQALELQVQREAEWDWGPVLYEDFSDERQFNQRWEIQGNAKWELRNGRLHVWDGIPQELVLKAEALKEKLQGDVRLEFECMQESDYLNDVSCRIGEYSFKFGGYDNSANALLGPGGRELFREFASPLVKGRLYRVRAERIGNTFRYFVNDRKVFEVQAPDRPLTEQRGYISLYGFQADTWWDNVRIYVPAPPMKADVLEIAERSMEKGNYFLARELFSEVAQFSTDPDRVERAQEGARNAALLSRYSNQMKRWLAQLQEHWPEEAMSLNLTMRGPALTLNGPQVQSLEPLRGIPLTRLTLTQTAVTDLSPLMDMKLEYLSAVDTPVQGIEVLARMPLVSLSLRVANPMTNLRWLEGCPLEELQLFGMSHLKDLSGLEAAPIRILEIYDGVVLTNLSAVALDRLEVVGFHGAVALGDVTPLEGANLRKLTLTQSAALRTLDVLAGMPLEYLDLSDCRLIEDFDVLSDLPLAQLNLNRTGFSDLKWLTYLPLTSLEVEDCEAISDLTPLRLLELRQLNISGTSVRDLSPLEDMPLAQLSLRNCEGVEDLSPIATLPLRSLDVRGCANLRNWAALDGLRLEVLRADRKRLRVLRPVLLRMESLKRVEVEDGTAIFPEAL